MSRPTATTEPDDAALREALTEQFEALVNRDADALDRLLADDFTAQHVTGYETSRAEWLGQVARGEFKYHAITPQSVDITLSGDTATVVSVADYDVTLGGHAGRYRLRSTLTYRRDGQRWVATRGVSRLS